MRSHPDRRRLRSLLTRRRLLPLLTALALAACGSDGGGDGAAKVPKPGLEELLAAGLGDHLGKAVVSDTAEADGVTTLTLDPTYGPRCLRGDPYRFSMRDGSSDELLIFLQGGGACWSEFCLAVNKAPAGVPLLESLDPARPENPYKDHDVVYLPYCDGSMFSGDRDHDDDGDGQADRFHRGLANLSAALDGAKARYPTPSRITLAGSSGGAYGTFAALPLLRHLYPDVPIDVVEDSGSGLGKPGDPAFLTKLLDEFGASRLIPESCTACQGADSLLPFRAWQFEHLANFRVASLAGLRDGILADVFLQIPGADFETMLRDRSGALAAAYPDRYRRMLRAGRFHTSLLGTPAAILGDDLSAVELPKGAIGQLAGIVLGTLRSTAPSGQTVAGWLMAMRAAPDSELGKQWTDIVPPRGGADGTGYAVPGPTSIGPTGRKAALRLPKNYDGVDPLPVVVLLGGYDYLAKDAEDWFALGPLCDSLGFALLMPDGVVDSAGSPTWNATDTCCDYDGVGTDDVGYLTALLDELALQVHVDPRRVVLFGHSAGGFMAYRMACDRSERVAAVVSVAGSGFKDEWLCKASAPVSVLQIHGDKDDVMPYGGDDEAPGALEITGRWASRNSCSKGAMTTEDDLLDLLDDNQSEDTKVSAYAGCAGGTEVRLWTLQGADHYPEPKPLFRSKSLGWALAHPRPAWPIPGVEP